MLIRGALQYPIRTYWLTIEKVHGAYGPRIIMIHIYILDCCMAITALCVDPQVKLPMNRYMYMYDLTMLRFNSHETELVNIRTYIHTQLKTIFQILQILNYMYMQLLQIHLVDDC